MKALTLTGGNGTGADLISNGGAIYNNNGTLTLTQCTLSGNSAGSFGGAIYNDSGALTLTNSLIAGGNTATLGPDIFFSSGTITATGVNLLGSLAGSTLTAGATVIVNPNPLLSPLADWGGPTKTFLPLPGSPARDAASVIAGLTTDQRGAPLPASGRDIGAVETGASVPGVSLVVTTTADEVNGLDVNGVSLREAVMLTPPGGTITFDNAFAGLAVAVASDLSVANVTLNTAVTGGSVNVAVNAGTLSFQGGSVWTGGGQILLGATSGTNAATVEVNGPDGFTLAAPITVRAGSSGTKTLKAANVSDGFTTNTNTFAGAITLQAPATVERTVGSGVQEFVDFTGQMDLGPHLLTVNASDVVYFSGPVGRTDGGNAPAQLVKTGSDSLILLGTADNPRLTATVNAGILYLDKTSSASVHALGSGLAPGTTALTVAGVATVNVGNSGSGGDQIADTASVTVDGSLSLYDSETLDVLNGGGTVDNGSITTNTLTLGAGNGSGNFTGGLNDGEPLSLTKTGTGTQTVAGGFMTGALSVNGGTLNVLGSLDHIASATVAGGATLSGTGTVVNVTLASGSFLAPGDATTAASIGTLNVVNRATSPAAPGSLTWNGGATARFHLSGTDNTSDKVALTAQLIKGSGSGFVFDFQGSGAPGQTYTLATFASSSGFTVGDFTATNLSSSIQGGFFTLTGTALTYTTYSTVVSSTADSGPGSLRSALATVPTGSTLTFDPSLNGGTVTLDSALTLSRNMTLDASALSSGLTVRRDTANPSSFRLFDVSAGTTVSLTGFTVTGGKSSQGGALLNDGTLTLTRMTFTGNTATIDGGALYNNSAAGIGRNITATDCVFSNNTATRNGGAILNYDSSSVTLTNCTLSGNSSSGTGVGGGGAIRNENGTVTLNRCTLSANSAVGSASTGGGGISNLGEITGTTAAVTLTQCTLSGNTTTAGVGGAISNRRTGGAATVSLTHCTVSANTASGAGGGLSNSGTGSATITIANCIVAGNTGTGTNPNLGGTITQQQANLTTGSPQLAPLGDYGGPTQTMALLPTSPARDAAVGSSITSDQRGFAIVGTPDIGAYEAGTFNSYDTWIWETLPATATTLQHATTFDFDGDGQSNGSEWIALTDASSAASYFRVTQSTVNGNTFNITFPTAVGRTYQLQSSPNLANPWTNIGTATPGTGGNVTLPVNTGTETRYFFRVSVQ